MAKLNRFVCAADFANTGIGDCPIIPMHIVGMFIVPKGFEITSANAVDLKTTLEEAAAKNLRKERILPIHHFVGVEDGSEDPTENTLGYGGISITREGNYDLTFQLGKGGMCLQKALRKYNKRPLSVLLYDADGMLFGAKSGDVMKGIPVELFYASPMKLSDGSTETSFHLRLVFKPNYFNENLAYIATQGEGFMLQEIEGLMDVELELVDRTLGVIQLKGFAGCGTVDVLKEYASELSDEANWTAIDPDNGSVVTITSVAVNASGVATITLTDDVDAVINLADVSTLTTAGVIGYEGRPLVSLKP